MPYKDYYKVLELKTTATQEEIKTSYRRLALKFHPDRNFGDKRSEAKFKEIQEAYEILSDPKSKYEYDKRCNNSKKEYSEKESESITPLTFLEIFRNMRVSVSSLRKSRVNREALFKRITDLLDKNCIVFLTTYGDKKTISVIIDEILICCNPLEPSSVNKLRPSLIALANSDKTLIDRINSYYKKRKKEYWSVKEIFGDFKDLLADKGISLSSVLALAIVIAIIWGISSLVDYFDNKDRPSTGELYNSSSTTTPNNDNNSQVSTKLTSSQQEDYSDWDPKNYETGSSPGCYNYTPKYNKTLDNKLQVNVGYNTDVVLKLINLQTNKCIRYVYVRAGDTYNMRNIPEGKYYLKIAYGKDWRQKIVAEKCIGKFISNPLYKKGSEILDFYKIYEGIEIKGGNSYKNYQIPSYSLSLDVISTPLSDQFQTNEISENAFNDEQ
jgi:hypothetical protein